ncbi:MAG: hypothetical protein FJ335_09815 [Sphingomonadales bacterium]|nr:hypothetical protein [Sphingomonadales bacterium]
MTFTITPIAVDAGYGEAILSLADAKAHLRVEQDDHDEDDLIGPLRDAAVDFVEQYTNVRLGRVAGEARFPGFDDRMVVGIGPAAAFEVTGISYRSASGADVALSSGDWEVDASAGVIRSPAAPWPQGRAVTVAFTAGYSAETCPPALIAAVKLMLGHLYSNRAAVVTAGGATEMPLGVKALCDRYRMPVL